MLLHITSFQDINIKKKKPKNEFYNDALKPKITCSLKIILLLNLKRRMVDVLTYNFGKIIKFLLEEMEEK